MSEKPQSSDDLGRLVARLFAIASVIALVILGALTAGARSIGAPGKSMIMVADTTTLSTPPSTPPVNSAAPSVKASPFQGGDWPNG